MSDAPEEQPLGADALCSLDDTTFVCKRCGVKLSKNDHFTISKHTEWVTHLNAAEPRLADEEDEEKKNRGRSSKRSAAGAGADRHDDDDDDEQDEQDERDDDGQDERDDDERDDDEERDDEWPSSVRDYEDYKRFLERNAGREVPDDGALYGPYVAMCYDETLKQIRSYVNGKKIWATFHETCAPPVGGRPELKVVNVIVGTLEAGRPGKMFLLTLEEYRGRDFWRLGRLVDDAMRLLWPDGVARHDDVLLFLSEPLEYVMRAVDSLKTAYPRMVHVTGTPDVVEHRVVGRVDRTLAESLALMDGLAAADDGGCWPCVRDILNMTAGYETMRAISRALKDEPAAADGLPEGLDADDLPFYEYAPVSLVDVHASYAPYRNMLVNAVPSYGFEIAKKTIVIQCNSAVLNDIRSSNRDHYNDQGIKTKSD